jgi:hypothetical protein
MEARISIVDRSGEGGFHHVEQPFAQRDEGDDQFGCVAERGIEEPADPLARAFGDVFGGPAEPARERQDREAGTGEDRDVRLRPRELEPNRNGHEEQEPVERGLEQVGHGI